MKLLNKITRQAQLSLAGLRRNTLASPIFVVGCGHSGTSSMVAILDSHSHIWAVPDESFVFSSYPEKLEEWVRDWDRSALVAGKRRWVEKTPNHIRRVGQILQRFPDARVIIMIRDGRDVACSIKARVNDFNAGIKRWVKDNRASEEYWEHPQVMIVKYEELVANPASKLAELCEFVGEPFEDEMLNFHQKERRWYGESVEKPDSGAGENHKVLRNWQINQLIYNGGGRWQREMSEEEKELFKREAGALLISLGYESDLNW